MPADLSQLQNFIKRDKTAYEEEFQLQHRHFLSELELFQQNPSNKSKTFTDLVSFISQIAPCYPEQLSEFPQQLCSLLEEHGSVLQIETRNAIAKALILLRNRDLLSPTILLPLFFKLFRIHDKQLRKLLRSHIVSDIKKLNLKKRNQNLNRTLQNFMSVMLRDASDIAARHSLDVMIELYRKRIWNDEKTVNIIAEACLSSNSKLIVSALQFFLSIEEITDDDDDKDDNSSKTSELQKMLHGHAKMTKKRKAKIQKMKDKVHKEKKRDDYLHPNFPAIQLINDPQGFAEKLFGALKKSTEKFEVRIMMMNLVSRLITSHKLQLINFYPWIQKYLQPHQEHVTNILCILAQAVHDLIDQDTILPTVKAIANNFISDRCSPNAMAVGLNTIREICLRCPFAIDDTLLQDLVQYKKAKDKSVTMAARALLALFRELDPSMLAKKDRGKNASTVQAKVFGELRAQTGVDGAELLDQDSDEEDFGEVYDEDGNLIDTVGEDDIHLEDDGESQEGEGEDDEAEGDEEEGEGEEIELESGDENGEGSEDENQEENAEMAKEQSPAGKKAPRSIFGMLAEDSKASKGKQPKVLAPEPTVRADMLRVLTDEDFEKIDALRLQKAANITSTKKRSRHDFESLQEVTDEIDEAKILTFVKKRKATYEERMASVMEGREGRDKFGSKKGDADRASTNLKKRKNQPFILQKHSRAVREKAARSAKEKLEVRKTHARNAISGDRKRKKH